MEVSDCIARSKHRIEAFLNLTLKAPAESSSQLYDAMRYSVLTGGKRLRAAYCYALENPLKIPKLVSDCIAASIECIHAASLVHDDLPALDNDSLRRQQAACHIKFGEATAILCGDALLMEGMAYILNIPGDLIPQDRILNMSKRLNHIVSAQGIMSGQMQDLFTLRKVSKLETIEAIYFKKTCLLLGAGLELMLIASGDPYLKYNDAFKNFSKHLGLGFQIQDDILDFEATTEVMGKPQYSDQASNKQTIPKILGLTESKARVLFHFDQANTLLNTELKLFPDLKAITALIQTRKF